MNTRSLIFLFLSAALSSLCTSNIRAEEPRANQAALIKNAQAFTEAFEKGDAKAAEKAIANLEKVDPSNQDLPQFRDKLTSLQSADKPK